MGRGNLRRHTNEVHLNIRDYQCWKCPKQFKNDRALNVHLVCVHKEVLENAEKMKSTEKAIGIYAYDKKISPPLRYNFLISEDIEYLVNF